MTMRRTAKIAVTLVFAVGAFALVAAPPAAFAVTVVKANNANDLNLGSSWVGGVAPTIADIARWDSTVLGANSTVLGGNVSWNGIAIVDPGGLVTIGTGNTLTLDTGGINMSAATQNLTISSGLSLLSGSQSWNIASGRTLTLNTGAFARSIGTTLNLPGSGIVAAAMTGLANDTSVGAGGVGPGILNPSISVGTGTSTQFATLSAGNIVAYTTPQVNSTAVAWGGIGSGGTGTVNHDITISGTPGPTGLGRNVNTIRYTGTGMTQQSNTSAILLTTNAIMNSGTGTFVIGTGGTSLNVGIGASNELVLNAASAGITIDDVISGAAGAGVTIAGSDVVAFNGVSTYTGPTHITGGTLQLTGPAAINSSSGITINGSNAKYLHTSSATSTRAILLTRGSVDGTGTIGAVTVGDLASNVVANGNAGAGALTMSSLAFGGDATVNIRAAVGAGINVTGALSTTPAQGTVTINPHNTGTWATGLNNLISYGSFSGAIGNFTLGTITGATGPRFTSFGGLALNGNNIALQVNGDLPVWSGAGGGVWQTATTGDNTGPNNWATKNAHTGTNFWAGDQVEFNDTYDVGGGPLAPVTTTATIQGGVSPSSTTFNNSAVDYTINTSDATGIAGTGTLIKNGTGLVTINTSNTYTGGTFVNNGTLTFASTNNFGTGAVTVSGGTLNLNNSNTYSGGTSLNGGTLNVGDNGALGTGAFTIAAGAAKILDATGAPRTLTTGITQAWNDDFTFTGSNDLDMGSNAVSMGGAGSDRTVTISAGTLAVGELRTTTTIGLVKQGAGTLALTSAGASGGAGADGSLISGTLNVAAGTIQMNRTGTSGAGSGDVTVGGLIGTGTVINGANDERWLFVNTTGNHDFAGTLTNGATGALGLNKQGAGTQTLSGTSTYSGTTTVAAGTLTIASASGATGPVNVAGGTLNFSGAGSLASASVYNLVQGTAGVLQVDSSSRLGAPLINIQSTGGAAGPGAGSTARLELSGGASLNNNITLAQRNDTNGSDAIRNVSGSNTLNGIVTITAGGNQARVRSDAGLLTLAGSITTDSTSARNLFLQGVGDGVVSGVISNNGGNPAGTVNINKEGTGTWTLSGLNTTGGTVSVAGGNLVYSGEHSGNGAFTVSNTGSVLTMSGDKTGIGSVTVGAGATMNLTSTGELRFDINNASSVSGSVLGTGTVDFDGLFILDIGDLSSTSGVWNLVNAAGLSDTYDGSTFNLQFINGNGNAAFTNSGGGIYTNGSGAGWLYNTSTGVLTLGAATLEIWSSDTNFDFSNNANWQDGTAPGAGATLLFGSVIIADRTITLDVPASADSISFDSAGPDYTIAGPNTLTLTGNSSVSVNAGGSHTISAVVNGSAGFTKAGSGILFLSADNGYTGNTQVQSGTLALRTAGAVDSNTVVSAGATLAFYGDNLGGGYNGGFAGVISGDGGVVLEDGATVSFTTTHTYNGTTNLFDASVMTLSGAGTLGASGGTPATQTFVAGNQNTSRIALSGGVNVGNEILSLGARELAGINAIHLTSAGANSWAGNIMGTTGGTQYNFESTSGTLTLSGTISAPDAAPTVPRNFVFTGAGDISLAANTGKLTDGTVNADGVIQAAGTLTNGVGNVNVIKRGAGTLTISTGTTNALDYWRGTTVIEQGTLAVDDALIADDGELRTSSIDVRAGATFDVSSFSSRYNLQVVDDPNTIPFDGDETGQIVRGAGTIKTGSATLGAFEDAIFTPGDSAGTLTIDGNLSIDQSQSNANGALNYELSNVTTVGGGVNDLIAVTGNLTLHANSFGDGQYKLRVTPIAGNLAAGPYTIMTRGGTTGDTATGADFTVSVVNAAGVPINTRQDDGAAVTINANNVQVTFTPAATSNWTGAGGGTWDLGTTASWSSSDNLFFDLDNVTFTDAPAIKTIDIPATVTPGTATFNNTTAYTFTGAAGIQTLPGANMTLNAGSSVILTNTANNLGGILTIAGTANLQHGDGVSTGTSTIGGTVNLAGSLTHASGTLNVTGVVSGSGSINVSAGTALMTNNNSGYTGQININGGNVDITNNGALGSTAGATVVAEGGQLRTFGVTINTPEPITLNGGAIRVGGGGAAAATFSGTVTLGPGESNFQLDGGTGDDGMAFAGNIVGSSGGTLVTGGDGGSRLLVTGSIQHNGSLTKNGGFELELQGTNTYSGPTTITGGMLDLEGANATLGLGNVNVIGGTLDISSGVLNAIADAAALSITGGVVNLGADINELVAALSLGGVSQGGGTYGGPDSGAQFTSSFFGGTGILTVGLTGDYNNDNAVDAADYVMWRHNNGGNEQAYTDWAANFGDTSGGGGGGSSNALNGGQSASGSVPEPASIILLAMASAAAVCGSRRRAAMR